MTAPQIGPSPRAQQLVAAAGLLLIGLGIWLHGGALELALFRHINAWGSALPALWAGLSLVGLGLSALLLAGALGPRHARLLAQLLTLLLLGGLLVQSLKHALALPRPLALLGPQAVSVIGEAMMARSMPSGHSALAFSVAALALPSRTGFTLLGLALAIGLARIAVGAHWPGDVLVGGGLGLLIGSGVARAAAIQRLAEQLGRPAAARSVALGLLLAAAAMAAWQLGTPQVEPLQWLLAGLGLLGAWSWWAGARGAAPQRPGWRRLAGLLLLAALLAWLALRFDPQSWQAELAAAQARLLAVPATLWLLTLSGLTASYALRASRLHAEWGGRAGVSWLECLRLTLQHIAALNLLPMRAGEASLPWQMHRRWGVPLQQAALSLLWIRLQDALALALMALLILLPAPAPLRIALVLALLAGIVGLLPRLLDRAGRHRLLARPVAALRERRSGALALACTLGSWLVKLSVLALLLGQLAGLAPAAAAGGALGGELAALWPVQAPAGLGSYEAGVWGGARLFIPGLSEPDAGARLLLAGLSLHLLSLCCACLAVLPSLLLPDGRRARCAPVAADSRLSPEPRMPA